MSVERERQDERLDRCTDLSATTNHLDTRTSVFGPLIVLHRVFFFFLFFRNARRSLLPSALGIWSGLP
jgi:hypothetical protein